MSIDYENLSKEELEWMLEYTMTIEDEVVGTKNQRKLVETKQKISELIGNREEKPHG